MILLQLKDTFRTRQATKNITRYESLYLTENSVDGRLSYVERELRRLNKTMTIIGVLAEVTPDYVGVTRTFHSKDESLLLNVEAGHFSSAFTATCKKLIGHIT